MNATRLSVIAAGVVTAAFLGATGAYVYLSIRNDPFASCRQSAVAGAGAIGGPFTLIAEDGREVTEAQVIDRPALVYFGYTFCPDVCPLDAARNAEAADLLAEMGHQVRPVLITLDPARDTAPVLAEWTDYMHPEMIGLTGSAEQVAEAARAYRVFYRLHEPDEDGYYLVDHSVFTYLMLPGTGFAEFFGRNVSAQDVARRSACFIEAAG